MLTVVIAGLKYKKLVISGISGLRKRGSHLLYL